MTKRLRDAMEFSSNRILVHLDREPRITDPAVYLDPARNPQFIEPGSRTASTDDRYEDVMRERFAACSTDDLYAILDGPFLLVENGQLVHRVLVERDAWDANRIGETSTVLDCQCSHCHPEHAEARRIVEESFKTIPAITLTRSAA